jgi:hypothetical protein
MILLRARCNLKEWKYAYDEGPGCVTPALRWARWEEKEESEYEYASYHYDRELDQKTHYPSR